VVSRLLNHATPAASAAMDEYWAARLLHLSHVNLLWQAWELNGEADLNRHEGWKRFAKRVASHLSKCDPSSTSQEEKACSDLWRELHDGIWPNAFVQWLERELK